MTNRVNSKRSQAFGKRGRLVGTTLAAVLLGSSAQAALVSVCSGVSLPRSVVTGIIGGPLNGIVTPVQGTVNSLLGALTGLPLIGGTLNPLLPAPLSIDVAGLLSNAASGAPITLQALATNGTIVGPADTCQSTADGYSLNTPAGISIGGNAITGLGNGTQASAGSLGAIALGNGATTSVAASNSIALGANTSATAANSVALGAGSTATRGAVAGYTAPGLAAPQTSAGEVSVGAPGATRQITNVAAGSAPTDAVNVSQVTAAITASAAASPLQYSNPATPTTPNGGVPTNDVTLVGGAAGAVTVHNVAPGVVAAGSTDAVDGGQLFTTNQNVATNTTNIAGNTATIATNTTNIAGNTNSITNLNNGTAGIVRQVGGAPGAGTITVGAQTAGTLVDFTGTGGSRRLTGILPGTVSDGSTDAVNGSQLFATNTNVAGNTTSITNLSTGINNGTLGLVQQIGGAPGAGIITVGAGTAGTTINVSGTGGTRTITGVTAGVNPTDAVNVSQLIAFGSPGANAVLYDTLGATRLNSITLIGGAAGPVNIRNVAPGILSGTSTDAVNGSQLFATNTNVTNNTTSITNLNNGTAGLVRQVGGSPGNGLITVGAETGGTNVSVAGTAGNRIVSGVAAGVAPTDAVNVSQLSAVSAGSANAVLYDTVGGVRQNTVTLAGGAAGPVTVTNVAAGALNATSTDAVNGAQLFATNTQVATNTTNIATNTTNIANNTTAIMNIQNGTSGIVQQTGGSPGTGPIIVGAATGGTIVNVTGTDGTRTVTGVTAGAVTAGSTDAVNGAQLFATNANVTTNTSSITNLTTNITNGTVGLVQQTGGAPGNGDITVGATTGGTTINVAGTGGDRIITGVAPGMAANDAATVGQLAMVTGGAFNAVQYDTVGGTRQNSITLVGGSAGPVTITDVAPGLVAAGSTDAVNGGQLASLTTTVAGNTSTINNIVNGQAGAFRSDNTAGAAAPAATGANSTAGGFGATASGPRDTSLGNGATSTGTNSVALGYASSDGGQSNVVSVGSVGGERRLTNVGPGLSGTDAVNLSQLQAATASFQATTGNLQNQINGLDYDLSRAKRLANAGTAGAMAVAGLPQAFTEGKGMIAGAVGYWQNQVAFAVGLSKIVGERTVLKAGGSVSGRGTAGFNAGVGFEF